jgi:hypothetical protein
MKFFINHGGMLTERIKEFGETKLMGLVDIFQSLKDYPGKLVSKMHASLILSEPFLATTKN